MAPGRGEIPGAFEFRTRARVFEGTGHASDQCTACGCAAFIVADRPAGHGDRRRRDIGRNRSGQRHGRSEATAAARQSRRSQDPGQGIVRPPRHRGATCRRARSASMPKAALPARVALPINGKTWQVMRLSRNRNWGHPELVAFLEQLRRKAPKLGWRGLLVGDIVAAARRTDADRARQPSGRPRRRHLADADAGARTHAAGARGDVGDHGGRARPQGRRPRSLDARACRDHQGGRRGPEGRAHLRQRRRSRRRSAATTGTDRGWLNKVRPIWGHDYHFHIRIGCPADSPDCKPQDAGAAPATAAARSSTGGSRDAVSSRSPRPSRKIRTPSRSRDRRGSRWRTCRPRAGRFCWRRRAWSQSKMISARRRSLRSSARRTATSSAIATAATAIT